jgi:hypothetical protein
MLMPTAIVLEAPSDLIPIEFTPVPEIDESQLNCVFAMARFRRRHQMRSYGAFVIRDATMLTVQTGLSLLRAMQEPGRRLTSHPFTQEADIPIHTDPAPMNNVTLHSAEAGSSEVIVMTNSLLAPVNNKADVTAQLYDNNLLDQYALSLPSEAYRTSLNEGDLLIFDDTQPHAFRSLTDERVSRGYYLTQRPAHPFEQPV